MQAIDGLTQFRDGSGVQKHVVRGGQTCGAAGLRGENRTGMLFGAAIARSDPLYLQRFVRIDNQDAIHSLSRAAAFHEQGYGHDHVWALRLYSLAFHIGADQGVEDGIKGVPQG